MAIDPIKWREHASVVWPKLRHLTDWFDGTTHPVWAGYYERFFTDHALSPSAAVQWWDGEFWRRSQHSDAHWRQVGDYPAWRGMTNASHKKLTKDAE